MYPQTPRKRSESLVQKKYLKKHGFKTLNLAKDIDFRFKKLRIPNRINSMKSLLRHMKIKVLKTKDKTFESSQGKKMTTYEKTVV